MQFLVGSVHVLKLPLFQRACEVAFNESDEDKDLYISLLEVILILFTYIKINIFFQFGWFHEISNLFSYTQLTV